MTEPTYTELTEPIYFLQFTEAEIDVLIRACLSIRLYTSAEKKLQAAKALAVAK